MLIEQITAWFWFILAVLLLIGEIILPGAQLIWLGFAALAAGLIVAAVSIGWQVQVLLFALLGLLAVLAGRFLLPRRPVGVGDSPFLNRRAEALIGRSFVLAGPILDGYGQVRVDDTVWRVAGPDAPAGTQVVVTAVDGTVLVVRWAEAAAGAATSGDGEA